MQKNELSDLKHELDEKLNCYANDEAYGRKQASMRLPTEVATELEKKFSEKFPNIEFHHNVFAGLYQKCLAKSKVDFKIYDYETYLEKEKRLIRNWPTVTTEEEYKNAKEQEQSVNQEYENELNEFYSICEILNSQEKLSDPSLDVENDVFKKICDYGFKIVPRNNIMKQFFNSYVEKRNIIENNQKIEDEKQSLEKSNTELTQENEQLTSKISKLQIMLKKTFEFCENVRNSRFGRFFFGKKLKELPSPEKDDFEK